MPVSSIVDASAATPTRPAARHHEGPILRVVPTLPATAERGREPKSRKRPSPPCTAAPRVPPARTPSAATTRTRASWCSQEASRRPARSSAGLGPSAGAPKAHPSPAGPRSTEVCASHRHRAGCAHANPNSSHRSLLRIVLRPRGRVQQHGPRRPRVGRGQQSRCRAADR
jgi:hypothetical protein